MPSLLVTSHSSDVLKDLLKEVSRSFYLTLRILPRPVRRPIGLAYLLARTSDTIADTELVAPAERLAALRQFREHLLAGDKMKLSLGDWADRQGDAAEKALLRRADEALLAIRAFPPDDQARIREALETIISGQELDLERFGSANRRHTRALQTLEELEDYTYRVAGCVGKFWTRICRAHLFPNAPLDEAQLLEDGVRFGKGLQLVNILRDLPQDLDAGRCYLPRTELAHASLEPEDLFDPAREPDFRRIYNPLLDLAESHLQAGWRYTNALPARQVRVRLACAWPVLIGLRTIAKLRDTPVLGAPRRIKISRKEVRQLILRSIAAYPISPLWQRLAPSFSPARKAFASQNVSK